MYTIRHMIQGLKYFKSSISQRIKHIRYKGAAEEICKQIIEANWNGTYFTTSTHHYREFWARDTGLVADALIRKGYKSELKKTVEYALAKYKKAGRITTTIAGKPFSFPELYSPDSTALFLYTAMKAGKNDRFFEKAAAEYAERALDDNGYVKPDRFSSMRDYAIRKSSCYNHCMSILMAKTCKKMRIAFPYSAKELSKNLETYWTGAYYKDDLENDVATGDANTFPYWVGAGKHFPIVLKTIQSLGLDKPFPLAYTNEKQKMITASILVPGWQQNTIWPMMGLPFIQIVKEHNKKKAEGYKKTYKQIIEKHGTLYEVYTKDGKPYKSLLYHSDEGMIWAANY